MHIRVINSEQLSRTPEDSTERNSFSLSSVVAVEFFMEISAERHDFLLRWSNYKTSKENLERKVSKQEVIVKALTPAVTQPKNKVCSLPDATRLLHGINKELMNRSGERETVLKRSVAQLMKRVATCSLLMIMCISRAIPK